MKQKIIVSTWHTTTRASITNNIGIILVVGKYFSDFFWDPLTILVVIFNLQHKYPVCSISNWYSCAISLMSDRSNKLVINVKFVDNNASSLFNFVKLRILRHEWIQIWKKVEEEREARWRSSPTGFQGYMLNPYPWLRSTNCWLCWIQDIGIVLGVTHSSSSIDKGSWFRSILETRVLLSKWIWNFST